MDDETKKKLARVKQLIGMASSEHVEEARSMAHLACKLIRECDFDVVVKEPQDAEHVAWANNRSPSAADMYEDILRARERPTASSYVYASWWSGGSKSSVGRSVGHSPDVRTRRYAMNPDIPMGQWTLKKWCSLREINCFGADCKKTIQPSEEAWHSTYEVRCKGCSPGPIGDAFNKK